MKKALTVYSVKYHYPTNLQAGTKWFTTLDVAKEFAKQDYTDNPVAHTYRNPVSIKEALDRCNETMRGE